MSTLCSNPLYESDHGIDTIQYERATLVVFGGGSQLDLLSRWVGAAASKAVAANDIPIYTVTNIVHVMEQSPVRVRSRHGHHKVCVDSVSCDEVTLDDFLH